MAGMVVAREEETAAARALEAAIVRALSVYLTPEPSNGLFDCTSPATTVTVAGVNVLDTDAAASIPDYDPISFRAELRRLILRGVAVVSPAGAGDVAWRLELNGRPILHMRANLTPSISELYPINVQNPRGGHRIVLFGRSLTGADVLNCRARVAGWATIHDTEPYGRID